MRRSLAVTVLLVGLGVAACSGDDDDVRPTATPVVTASTTGGTVTASPWFTPIPPSNSNASPGQLENIPPNLNAGMIRLDQPIPYPIPFTIAGRDVMLPTGSTLEDQQNDPGGEIITVRRGESKAVFNGDTGEVIEWDVRDEDEADFESLRLPD